MKKTTLTVIEPFGDYQRGEQITDAKTVRAVLDSENAASVNRVQATDDAPADPAPQAK
jgi:hypothetical protein